MGNEASKGRNSGVGARTGGGSKHNATSSKHVQINEGGRTSSNKGNKQKSPMTTPVHSAGTFGQNNAQQQTKKTGGGGGGHHNPHSNKPANADGVMITDAMSDVRVNYHIDPKELGHGHYGVVRKCMHRPTQEWFAIKSIRKAKVSKIEVLKREIEILKEVKHPHIIALREVYEDERYLHLITELCTGGELFDRIIAKTQSTEGHFSEHDAARLVRDILDAIRYCHDEKNIVHRDLKPENFLFLTKAEDAPIKIIDFGLSRHDDSVLGIMQTKVGTPYYVAPEVLRREYTKSCDIWSIGVICYILLCGYPPFYGDSDTQIFESVKVGKFDFPSPEWDDISASAKRFVISLLKKSPHDRPSAAQAMKHKWLEEQLGADDDDDAMKASQGAGGAQPRRASLTHRGARTAVYTKYLAMKKLKKAALGYLAGNLSPQEVTQLRTIFQSMDQNQDGYITLTELDEAIAQGNFANVQQFNVQSIRELRRNLSLADDDRLNYKDFVAATLDQGLVKREDAMRRAFDHFARHHNPQTSDTECITLEDLTHILGDDAQQAKEIMALIDSDGDSKVSFEDFKTAMLDQTETDDTDKMNVDNEDDMQC